jgi:2,3-bisphosphoglycerate-independent phosphoglycerate mutase
MMETEKNDFYLVLQALGDIRRTQINQAEVSGRIEANLAALSGPEGRVTKLENTNTRQWWLHAAVLPLVFIFKGVAKHLGLDA